MSKKDITYIKHLKPQIKETERKQRDYNANRKQREAIIILNRNVYTANEEHNNKCKLAHDMDASARLRSFAITGDATYLGVGCKWGEEEERTRMFKSGIVRAFWGALLGRE